MITWWFTTSSSNKTNTSSWCWGSFLKRAIGLTYVGSLDLSLGRAFLLGKPIFGLYRLFVVFYPTRYRPLCYTTSFGQLLVVKHLIYHYELMEVGRFMVLAPPTAIRLLCQPVPLGGLLGGLLMQFQVHLKIYRYTFIIVAPIKMQEHEAACGSDEFPSHDALVDQYLRRRAALITEEQKQRHGLRPQSNFKSDNGYDGLTGRYARRSLPKVAIADSRASVRDRL
jgi:hypothetical protein